MSVLSDVLDFLKKIVAETLAQISEGVDGVLAQASAVFDLKATAEKDYQELQKEIASIFIKSAQFKIDAKNLRSRVIRADLAFAIVHDIFDGSLKKFAIDSFNEIHSTIDGALEEVLKAGKDVGAVKTNQAGGIPGAFGKLISALNKVIIIWKTIGKVIKIMRAILPVLKELETKLEHFEKLIMSQKSKPNYVPVRFKYQSRRAAKITGLEADPAGTILRLGQKIETINLLEAEIESLLRG